MNPQQITLTCANPPIVVSALRGQTAPVNTGGYSGWTTIQRPRRKSLTEWDGIEPLTVVLSLLFDGVATDTSISDDIIRLERMARPPSQGAEPPIVRVTGAAPHTDLDWVIAQPDGGDGLEFDPDPIWSRNGYRTRQEVTVHLLEYVADDRLAEAPAAERARRAAAHAAAAAAKKAGVKTGQAPRAKVYTVKAGDTLSTIAARLLGSYKRWPEIATLNGLRDPNRVTVGQTLRLP